MFISGRHLRAELESGRLIIDPLLDEEGEIGPVAIDLRIGRYFQELPSAALVRSDSGTRSASVEQKMEYRTISVEIGQSLILQPKAQLLATTLELIQLPTNLLAIVFPRSTLSRIGLNVAPFIVHPGFHGNLLFSLLNYGNVPLSLDPGTRCLRILFARTSDSAIRDVYHGRYTAQLNPLVSEPAIDPSIERLKSMFAERQTELRKKTRSKTSIRALLESAIRSEGNAKGRALERLMVEVFDTINGLKVVKVNARLRAEEIDVLLRNDIEFGFWRLVGSPILVECKNWSSKVGAKEISVLFDKMVSMGPRAKLGILVAPLGVSGSPHSDALLKIREKRISGRDIIILDLKDLERIAEGMHAADILQDKYDQLFTI